VQGPHNVVPDFLSYPWVDEQGHDQVAIHPLHLLSMATPVRHTSLHSLQQDPCSLVVVLPTWKGSVAVQQRGGRVASGHQHVKRVTPLCRLSNVSSQHSHVTPWRSLSSHRTRGTAGGCGALSDGLSGGGNPVGNTGEC